MGGASNVAVRAIADEFHADAAALSWFVTSFLVVSAMFLLPFGRLGDLWGRKRTFQAGGAVFCVGSALCVAAPSLALLIAARAVQGAGGAMLAATAPAILISVFPPQERGRVLGINTAAVYAGLAAGPVVGGVLTSLAGWRSIFLLGLVAAELAFLLTRLRLRGDWAEARGEGFDFAGAALCALGLGPLSVGVTLLGSWWAAPWLAAGGGAALVAFVWWESRTKQPILEVGLFRHNRLFALSNVAALISYAATFATTYLLSLYLQVVRDLSPRNAGFVLLTAPVFQAVLSPWAGKLSDRVAPRIVSSVGMGLCAAALGLFALVDAQTPLVLLIGEIALLGVGFALFSSPNMNAVMSSVERRQLGVAAATVGTMRTVGMTMSMAVVTLLLTAHLGSREITPVVAGPYVEAMRVSFALFAGLCVLGVPASLARGKGRGGKEATDGHR
ncbi:MAG: MFS transporter [Deltaproteobacteria bacterium]|nr:MFS transporter [Deltaproteobacteria bacterium]